MTTVILTPTHIAQDHTVTHSTYPHYTEIDPNYKKIIVSPNRDFLIATCGTFNPHEVESDEVFDVFESILKAAIDLSPKEERLVTNLNHENGVEVFKRVFDQGGHTLLVTKQHRFLVFFSEKKNCLGTVTCRDIMGVGSGSTYAEGLIRAGIDIHDIWPKLHEMDPLTSSVFTCIALDTLADWKDEK